MIIERIRYRNDAYIAKKVPRRGHKTITDFNDFYKGNQFNLFLVTIINTLGLVLPNMGWEIVSRWVSH